MCDNGKKDISLCLSPMTLANDSVKHLAAHVILSCESITAFGKPVVPDV